MNPIAKTLVRVARRGAMKAQKHLPEILLVGGSVGIVASTVLACKATIKAQPILDEAKDNIEAVHIAESDPRVSDEEYSKEQATKDLTRIYIQTGTKLAKIYAPAAIVGFASMSCLIGSNVIVRKRLTAAIAAYTALGESFRRYRDQVEQELGHKFLPTPDTIEADSESDEHVINIEQPIRSYRFIFDRTNPNWKDDINFNLSFCRGAQRYLDFLLQRDHILFVNDFCKEMGFKITETGQYDGWTLDDKDPSSYKDGYVSFGLLNRDGSESEALRAYKNGEVDYLVLDLNIDGTVVDRI